MIDIPKKLDISMVPTKSVKKKSYIASAKDGEDYNPVGNFDKKKLTA